MRVECCVCCVCCAHLQIDMDPLHLLNIASQNSGDEQEKATCPKRVDPVIVSSVY